MFNNHFYNLINQLVEEHKSLWRIKKMYKKDSGKCKSCKNFWLSLEKDKENYIKKLENLVKSHFK